MKATITSIELKGPFQFFALSKQALAITRQLRSTPCKVFKKRGFWTKHYTMTLWNNEEELQAFARNGAHLEAMKQSKEIAKEIRTLTIEVDALPKWKEAKRMLHSARAIRYNK